MDIGAELTQLTAGLDGIAHVLRDRRLLVPQYQRSYSWQLEQVRTFWSDLRASFITPSSGYFLGTVVLARPPGKRESTIIDGQQRLATTALLLAAIRDEFQLRNAQDHATSFQMEFLSYLDMESSTKRPRLTLNTRDAELYGQIAVGAPLPEPKAASTKRILDAHKFFRSSISDEAARSGDKWIGQLTRWADFLEQSVRIIIVEVPSSTDAFLVFETLNDRGIALTVADLLKNVLFGLSAAKVDNTSHNWEATVEQLDAADNEQRLLDFLRHYWSSLYGATRERDLYRSFRARISSPEHAVELSERLVDASQSYYALTSGRSELWPAGSITANEAHTLRILRITQNWPLLLAAIDHFEPRELATLVRASICWSVRGIVAGGIGGGTAERVYCDAAVRIRNGRIHTTSAVLEVVRAIVPSDEEFRTAVQNMGAPKAQITRYLLESFERHEDRRPYPFLAQPDSEQPATAQKILPASPAQQWPAFENEDTVTWSKRLGNYVLLNRGASIRGADRSWADIQDAARESSYHRSRRLLSYEQWSPDSILLWQSDLASSAAEVWPAEPRNDA